MEVAQVPTRLDMVAYSGDDFTLLLEIVTVGSNGTETPVDFTGSTAKMQLKARPTDTTNILQLTSTPAAGLSFPALGELQIELTATQTGTTLPKAALFYDLQITDSLGKVRTYFTGMFTVKSDVTR